MTLLVLDLRVPAEETWRARALWSPGAVSDEQPVWQALTHVGPQFLICLLGFLTLGMFWIGQQTQLNLLERADRSLTWIHIMFLFGICLVPFATSLLAAFPQSRLAVLVYWIDLLYLGLVQLAGLRYARRADLLAESTPSEDVTAVRHRIGIFQLLYLVSVALSPISTYLSIGLLIALQVYSAVSPRIGGLDRL